MMPKKIQIKHVTDEMVLDALLDRARNVCASVAMNDAQFRLHNIASIIEMKHGAPEKVAFAATERTLDRIVGFGDIKEDMTTLCSLLFKHKYELSQAEFKTEHWQTLFLITWKTEIDADVLREKAYWNRHHQTMARYGWTA